MLFHVMMTVKVPSGTDSHFTALNAKEHGASQSLQRSGKWVNLWRVAGKSANVSIFRVDDPDELHQILTSLPLFPYMDIDVTALAHHPGAIEPGEKPSPEV
jgi:muconolactone D-isomerase